MDDSIESRSVEGLALDEAVHFWGGVTGIYLISTPDGLPYVGKSKNIGKRMQGHLSLLDSDVQTHHSPKMTEAKWSGATGFTVQLLEECSYAELRDRERHWMRKYPDAINDKMSNRLRGQGEPSRKLTRVRCNIPIPMELAARLHEIAEGGRDHDGSVRCRSTQESRKGNEEMKDESEPAFPVTSSMGSERNGHQNGSSTWQNYGLTMRDYFAAKAMQGLIAGCFKEIAERDTEMAEKFVADCGVSAYEFADSMLAARKK